MSTLVSDALGTIEGIEEALGITGTAEQRDVMTRMLNGITAAIHRHTGRLLRSRAFTPATTPKHSIFNGQGFSHMYLPNYPITTLNELSIGLTKFREIVRRANTAVTATTLIAGGVFTFDAQDSELSRGISSVSPNNSTEETEAVITSIAGAVATFSGGWSNGVPAVGADWWFQEGVYLTEESGKLVLSGDLFIEGNKNVRVSFVGGYVDGDPELDQLQELVTSLVSYMFQKAGKTGFVSETMGSYSYRLDSPQFKDFWNMNDIGGLDQFIDLRKLL